MTPRLFRNSADECQQELSLYEEPRCSPFGLLKPPLHTEAGHRRYTAKGDKLAAQFGIDPKVMAYLGKVAEAAEGSA
jgi:hypothetical protein